MLGHRVPVAPMDPRLFESIRHPACELGEVRVDVLVRTSAGLQRQCMILIGEHRLLATCFASQRQPRPGDRWLAEPSDAELHEPPREGVDRHRDHVSDVDRIDARTDERRDRLREVARRCDGGAVVRRTFDRALEDERGPLGQAEQVGVGDHPDHRAGAVGHGEMVDPSFEHPEEHLRDTGLCWNRDDRARHDLRHGGVGGAPGREDPRAQIAVGDDAPAFPEGDQERGHALLGHQRGDLGDGRVRWRRHERASHLRADAGEQVRHLGWRDRRVQAPARHRGEEPSTAGALQELLRQSPRDQVTERVLGRANARDGSLAGYERELAEGLALTDEIDQTALVEDLDRSLAHDVQVGGRLAGALEDRGADREELDLGGGRDPGQLVDREALERGELGKEPGDVHRPGLCAARPTIRPHPALVIWGARSGAPCDERWRRSRDPGGGSEHLRGWRRQRSRSRVCS